MKIIDQLPFRRPNTNSKFKLLHRSNHHLYYLIGQLCTERDVLGDGAQVVEHGDAGAVNEIGVAEGERGRVQVRLVVARELNRLPLALLDLKGGRCKLLAFSAAEVIHVQKLTNKLALMFQEKLLRSSTQLVDLVNFSNKCWPGGNEKKSQVSGMFVDAVS